MGLSIQPPAMRLFASAFRFSAGGHVDDLDHACLQLRTTGGFVNGQALQMNDGETMF